ncbi:hypothetical protein ACQP04_35965 [Pseudonocardia halophobica]
MDRPLAVGTTPPETRREVLRHVATRAEELGSSRVSLAGSPPGGSAAT